MADTDKRLIDTVIENQATIHDNLEKIQDIISESLAGDDWDRITALGIAGKLLDVCKSDVNNSKISIERIREELNGSNTGSENRES